MSSIAALEVQIQAILDADPSTGSLGTLEWASIYESSDYRDGIEEGVLLAIELALKKMHPAYTFDVQEGTVTATL